VQRVLYFVIEQKELMHTSLIYPDFYIVKFKADTSFHLKVGLHATTLIFQHMHWQCLLVQELDSDMHCHWLTADSE
jgi:hypothetical protein